MTQGPKKRIPKRTLTELQSQGTSHLTSNIGSFTRQITYRLYSFVPGQLRWLFPFIGEDFREAFKNRQGQEPDLEEDQLQGQVEVETVYLYLPPGVSYSYDKYRCLEGDPLSCDQPRQTIEQDPEAKSCMKCGFPAILRTRAEIQGKRGRYRITRLLGRRGMGRLYEGVQLGEAQPIVVKEYLLPKRYFNQNESIQAKKAFESLGGVNLADGRVENSRLISPTEAIADRNDEERCYIINRGREDTYSTLRVYLAQNGPMSPRQVRHVLNQVLQSLESLHGQKFRLPTGQIQPGLAHGNLSLDSLLISPQQQLFFHTPQFLIYLCDLALWERRFDPPPSVAITPKLSQDLIALGYVSFYLLAGGWVDSKGEPLNPQSNQHWPKRDLPLKHFIFRLLELEVPFESAETARQALLGLPTEELAPREDVEEAELPVKRNRIPYWLWWLLAILALALLGGAIWWWLLRSQAIATRGEFIHCCIKDVSAVPIGRFTYTAEQNGIWTYVLQQQNLIEKNKTLEAELAKRRPQLQLTYLPEPTGEKAIAKVRQEQVDFAITSLIDNLTNDLEAEEFAYDGLVVFVAFSYERRDKTLPKFLQGRITFEQLRQLYTGKISNWKDLGGPDLPVRLYMPTETETVRIFEQRVLKNDPQLIAEFRQLWQPQAASDSSIITQQTNKIIQLPTLPTLRTVLRDFEDAQVGGIGFGPLSKVFGQCSVYPLAIVDANNSPVQPLIQDNANPIEPATDLCDKKGSYRPNIEVFQTRRYPLAYPLAVIYPRDNSRPPVGKKFAEILKTEESQQLLSKTGLVPLQSLK